MMALLSALADEQPPGVHPTVSACSGSGFCDFNYDTLISTALAMLVTLAVGFWIASRVKQSLASGRPGKLQMIFELFLAYVRDMVRDTVAEDAAFVVPLAATIGFFILVANWLDFFPLQRPVEPANADINLTAAMGIVVILIVQAYAFKVQGVKGYFRRFTKPFEMNIVVRILFIPLNIVEEVVKPVTLALRLFGNIFAGLLMVYLLGLLFSAGLGGFGGNSIWAPLGEIGLIAWKVFDVFFVGTIQAFIFMLLTIIYFGHAREGLDEHGHGAAVAAH